MALWVCGAAWANDEPPGLLDRFLDKVAGDLARLPDHVCTLRIERFARGMNEGAWKQADSATLSVGLAEGREIYDRPDGAPGETLARDGVFSTGQFALLARHVFTWKAAGFGFRGESERSGRKAYEYEFDIPKQQSTYRLRMGQAGDLVAFQGSFHVDAETLDLLELEIQPYDIPEAIGLARADTRLAYRRVDVRGADALLPAAATLVVATTDGVEWMNRASFGECKRFEAESSLRAETEVAAPNPTVAPASSSSGRLIPGSLLEIQLDAPLTPKSLKPGDPVRARLAKPAEVEGGILPAGTAVHGVVARLREEPAPFPLFEIGFELTGVETGGETLPLRATMINVESQRGLIRQSKRIDPTFSKNQKPRLDVLVREVQKGQGILLWDAKHPALPKGLKMTWRVAGRMD